MYFHEMLHIYICLSKISLIYYQWINTCLEYIKTLLKHIQYGSLTIAITESINISKSCFENSKLFFKGGGCCKIIIIVISHSKGDNLTFTDIDDVRVVEFGHDLDFSPNSIDFCFVIDLMLFDVLDCHLKRLKNRKL